MCLECRLPMIVLTCDTQGLEKNCGKLCNGKLACIAKESILGPDLRHFHQFQNNLSFPESSQAAIICSHIL